MKAPRGQAFGREATNTWPWLKEILLILYSKQMKANDLLMDMVQHWW